MMKQSTMQLVFYCCITNYHKLEALNNTTVLAHSSFRQKSGMAC